MDDSAPLIETDRLILRRKRLDDFPPYAAMWAAPEVARFTGGKPLSREAAWTKFCRIEGFWALKGCGFFVIEEKASGEFIGEAGAAEFKRDIEPPLDGMLEFGWGLVPSVHGRGYASEALAAAIDWAEKNRPEETYCCIISLDNAASIRLAEKFGFQKTREARYHGDLIGVFERARG